jgi:hypothetical protein
LVALTRLATRLLPAACLLVANSARAEGERALSAGVGWATFSAPGPADKNMEPTVIGTNAGGTLFGCYEHAIGTDFSLRAELAGGLFHGGNTDKQSPMSYAAIGDAGAVFRFDILRYVPYAFGGVGGILTTGGVLDGGAQLALAIGGGVDYLVDRGKSFGLEARFASFGGDVSIFTLSFRATTRWGYF